MEGEKPVENKRGKTGSPAINGLLQVRSCIGVATCSLLHWKVFFSINNLGRTMSSLDYLKQKKKEKKLVMDRLVASLWRYRLFIGNRNEILQG